MDRSDAENEGVWKWVTGPEAELPLEDSLVVQLLSQIISPLVNEPNQYNGAQEDYAHIAPGVGARFLE
jgi:hypothetical protein